ncbi:nucleolar protein 12 [Brachypodium distachyon]|uniref:Ribosomal RNA-processing protein 17 n=1 Tax=Brachypodium distachyon TaxID=15368 RepID=I1H5F0_BRADI|nr:nucleolar protein 12 [Brachypodium distachyon]KQK21668.1 hypothetical protein BRADI_1g62290v3 [Brachypodium distachyon]|eukprot:XP_003557889.1 nucleolar protein 12 [Brachypodium distachyon]
MAWEEEGVEDEHEEEMEASEEEEEEDVVVGQMPTVMVPKHINKRALKNKALSVSLDKKALKDFVTGFHKRKKKRRKEANKITQEKERRRRIEARKKRKQEKEIALYGKVLSSDNADGDGDNDGGEMDEDLSAAAPEIKTYEDGRTRITVVTSEITHEDEDLGPKRVAPASTSFANKSSVAASAKKNPSLGVKRKPAKRTMRSKSKGKKKGDKKRTDTSRRKNKG